MQDYKCLCGSGDVQTRSLSGPETYRVECKICGTYDITGQAARAVPTGAQYAARLPALRGTVRWAHEHRERYQVSLNDLEGPEIAVPDVARRADRVLEWIALRIDSPSGRVSIISTSDFPIVYGKEAADMTYFLQYLTNRAWIEESQLHDDHYMLTIDGWKRLDEMKRATASSATAFVAMWFDPDLEKAWVEGLRLGVQDAGYEAIRIDKVEHNEKICDRILAEIRRSRLLVADFTGHRQGVYFEAGFALGLGIPVVWCARKAALDASHFDTRQYNHIVWDDAAELRERLRDRILATVGPGPKRAAGL